MATAASHSDVPMKRCVKCKDRKPLKEFYRHPMGWDGRFTKCKACVRKYSKKYRKTHKIQCSEYDRNRQQTPERKLYMKIQQRKRRARLKQQQ